MGSNALRPGLPGLLRAGLLKAEPGADAEPAASLWLWMARATSQGRNWARILSTVLFGLATLELLSALEVIGKDGVAQAFFAALTWLSGLAAVWLLWRPASSAFFMRCRQAALTRQP